MSESAAMAFGLLLATFGPLLLAPVIWAVYRWPLRRLLGTWAQRRFGAGAPAVLFAASALLTGAMVTASWLPGRIEYARLCEAHTRPVIAERIDVTGFYATALYAYEAEQYLREWKFDYVEAPDMYKKERWLRYSIGADGKTVVGEISAPQSRHAVSRTTQVLGNTITLSEKRVFERAGGRELARAGSVIYHGGPLQLGLGVYGMRNCPDPRGAEGARWFDDYYYLERKVLRAAPER